MKFVLVTKEQEIVSAAQKAYGTHYQLSVYEDWIQALESCSDADALVVDLLATLEKPNKIDGYEKFALAKMAHDSAKTVPLIVISQPPEYELDSMVGWPNFLFAMVRRPVSERTFRQISGWV
jgi:hypothetical protein